MGEFEFYSDEHIDKLQKYIEENFTMDRCSCSMVNNILKFAAGAEDDESTLRILEMLLDGIGIKRTEIVKAVVEKIPDTQDTDKDMFYDLWKKAQQMAKEEYEKEYGSGSWEERADKYEREDYVWATFKKLEGESKMLYGIVLKEKESTYGLTRSDMIDLFNMLDNIEAFPIELEAKYHECSAMGFITPEAAELLDYDYEESGLHDFVALILDDMNKEADDCEYEFRGIKIWLSR